MDNASKPTLAGKPTVTVSFSTRSGALRKEWALVRLTAHYAVLQAPDHTPGATTRFRLDDGLEAGAWLAILGWKIAPDELSRLRAAAPAPRPAKVAK